MVIAVMKLKDAYPMEGNLDSIFKSRDITLPTKVRLVKAMVFPVVMDGCESWTVKKAEVEFNQPLFDMLSRLYFANKGSSSQGYGFSYGHVWM